MLALVAARRSMAALAGDSKRALHRPLRDGAREALVRRRSGRLGSWLRLPDAVVQELMDLLMSDARGMQMRRQSLSSSTAATAMPDPTVSTLSFHPLLRLVPPPGRWQPLLRLLPPPLHTSAMETALSHALCPASVGSALEAVEGRRLGIEVDDLGLKWVFRWRSGRLHAVRDAAEATVRGSATDLMLLASRLEDADTLFFQRRLVLTGDTELGLTVRNLLDRMPWESLPLGLRIVLQRSARLARAARDAYRS